MVTHKVVIVSSGQPSANPRLVKEAITLFEIGYCVTVIYCPLSPWADEFDEQLFKLYPGINWIKAGYHPLKQKWGYCFARIRQKIFQSVLKILQNRFDAAIKSMVLFSQELIKEAKNQSADLYIGHNLGALPAVVKAAKQNVAFAAFDFEDFHRGEAVKDSMLWKKTKQTEEKYVPSLAFALVASPLIAKEYQNIFPRLSFTTINNCFSVIFAVKKSNLLLNKPLKLFWFSQTIGKERGLEDIIQALKVIPKGPFSLTLLGSCSNEMRLYLNNLAKTEKNNSVKLYFLDPVNPNMIFNIASHYDIGLALEPGRDLNNQIALSNKIFTYLLAGNAIIFSATQAQQLFYDENPGIGSIYKCGCTKELANILQNYNHNPELLIEHKRNAAKLAVAKYNWEEESKKLIKVVGFDIKDA